MWVWSTWLQYVNAAVKIKSGISCCYESRIPQGIGMSSLKVGTHRGSCYAADIILTLIQNTCPHSSQEELTYLFESSTQRISGQEMKQKHSGTRVWSSQIRVRQLFWWISSLHYFFLCSLKAFCYRKLYEISQFVWRIKAVRFAVGAVVQEI